jgi:hypothetical protein
MPELIEGSDNVFCFHPFLIEVSSDDRLHPFTPCDGSISDARRILVEGDRDLGSWSSPKPFTEVPFKIRHESKFRRPKRAFLAKGVFPTKGNECLIS